MGCSRAILVLELVLGEVRLKEADGIVFTTRDRLLC